MKSEIERLSAKITGERFQKMLRVLDNRTRRITVALEDIFQPHNASAVLRNCDAFGIQDAVFIENKYLQNVVRNVDMGAGKWITLRRFVSERACEIKKGRGLSDKHTISNCERENTVRALDDLHARGYALAASTLRGDAGSVDDIPVDKPLALLVGTELTGLSEAAHEKADYLFKLPMSGFAQSFNLSVFTALCLSNFSKRMRASGEAWKLSEVERDEILLSWLKISVGEEQGDKKNSAQ